MRTESAPGPVGLSGGHGRTRALLLTSHPLEGRDGADKEIAISIAAALPHVDWTWFGRWPGQRTPDVAGHRIPMLSRRGRPEAPEQAQAALHAARLAPRMDLVHAVMTVGPRFPAFTRLLDGVRRGTPVVHTVPGVVDVAVLERCRPLGPTVALSEHTAGHLRDAGFPDVRVIAPSVSLDRWSLAPAPEGLPVVLFAGHHDRGGGAEEAVAIAARAALRGARFRLVLALRARPGEHALGEAERLLRSAAEQGLTDVQVLGRVADMPALLASSSVLLFPPRTLAGKADVPLTVIEALATGRAVVATDLPHFASLGDAVVRVGVDEPEAGGRALAEVLADLPAVLAAAPERRAAVEAAFSPGATAQAYTALYEEVLGSRPAARA